MPSAVKNISRNSIRKNTVKFRSSSRLWGETNTLWKINTKNNHVFDGSFHEAIGSGDYFVMKKSYRQFYNIEHLILMGR